MTNSSTEPAGAKSASHISVEPWYDGKFSQAADPQAFHIRHLCNQDVSAFGIGQLHGFDLRPWPRIEHVLHRLPHQNQNRERPENRSKGHENTFDAGHDEAKGVVLLSSDKPSSKHNQETECPAGQNEEGRHKNQKPPDKGRRLIGAWAKSPWCDNHKHPHGQMDQREARKERCQTTNNIMENGQELEVFAVRRLLWQDWPVIEHGMKMS
jgi:hypothetical protein